MSQENRNLRLVLAGWVDALRRRDLDAIAAHLHPEVVWEGLRPGIGCPDRTAVLDNIREGPDHSADVVALELRAHGDRVLFGFEAPGLTEVAGEPVEGQIYEVFTLRDDKIVRIAEFKDRAAAAAALAGD